MRRVISFITGVVFLLALVQMPVMADTGLEQAILSVKSKIDIPADYTEFGSDVTSDINQKQYYLSWSRPEQDFVSTASISVTINDKGDVLSYNHYISDTYSDDVKLSKYSEEQLKDIASEWTKKVNPDWMAELPEDMITAASASLYGGRSYVGMMRMVNGVKFCGNNVNIGIDNQTGAVLSMSADWTYVDEVPSLDAVIGDEAAQAAIAALSPMELSYVDGGNKNGFLVYTPTDEYAMIDANTGERVVFNNAENAFETATMSAGGGAAEDATADRALTKQEIANIEQVEGLIPEETLRAFGSGLTELGLDQAQYLSCEYRRIGNRDGADSYHAILNYLFINGDEERSATLTVDAKTCELLSYYTYVPYIYDSEIKPKVSLTDAEGIAKAFAEKYADEYKSTQLQPTSDVAYYGTYVFRFIRHENGVPFSRHGISVSVSGETGRITSFYKSWEDGYTFESTEGILDADAAMQALFVYAPVELQYIDLNGRYSEAKPEVRAIYQMNTWHGTTIGARSGKLVGYNGQELVNETTIATADDISGHYGEAAILALLQAGVIELDEGQTSFRPDATITQQELLAFVSGLQGNYTPYPVLRVVSRNGLLKEGEWDPGKEQQRQDGVKYIIRALGYEKVATLSGIYDCGFADRADISEGYEGYVALARGLGIVNGDGNNCFNPRASLTRADAAIMIYNYLTN